jgi:hypothetical protein
VGGASANSLPEEQTDRPPTPDLESELCSPRTPPRARARGGRGDHRATPSRSRCMFRASFSCSFRPLNSEGAGNAGRPMRPIAACAEVVVAGTRVGQVTPATSGIPRAMVYGLFRALPGDRAFLSPSPAGISSHRLDASVETSGPHDFAVRLTRRSSKALSASTASRPAFVTIAKRPSFWDGMNSLYSCFYQTGKRNIFRGGAGQRVAWRTK